MNNFVNQLPDWTYTIPSQISQLKHTLVMFLYGVAREQTTGVDEYLKLSMFIKVDTVYKFLKCNYSSVQPFGGQ